MATTPDAAALEEIHAGLARNGAAAGRAPARLRYPSAEQIVRSARTYGVTLIALVLLDQSTQARAAQGYDTASFSFDVDQRRGTCPEDRTSASWIPCRQRDTDAIVVTGARTICGPCPKRELCTKGRQRQITIRDRDLHEALAAARAEQTTDEWKRRYATRAGVEGTMRQSTHATAGRLLADAQDADDGDRSLADGRMIERPVPGVRGGAFVGVLSVWSAR